MNMELSIEERIVDELLAVRAAEERIARGLEGRKAAGDLFGELSELKEKLSRLESFLAGRETSQLELQLV